MLAKMPTVPVYLQKLANVLTIEKHYEKSRAFIVQMERKRVCWMKVDSNSDEGRQRNPIILVAPERGAVYIKATRS